jgi:hypothetical protein
MNHLRRVLKKHSISPEKLGEAMGVPFSTLIYNFSTGRIPFVIIYRLHLATGLSINEIVPDYVAQEWVHINNEKASTYQKRGREKGWNGSRWSENLELDEPMADQAPPEAPEPTQVHSPAVTTRLKISRETSVKQEPRLPKITNAEPLLPKTVTTPKPTRKRGSIADIMSGQTPVKEQNEPDFTDMDIPDSVFQTSADQNPVRRGR